MSLFGDDDDDSPPAAETGANESMGGIVVFLIFAALLALAFRKQIGNGLQSLTGPAQPASGASPPATYAAANPPHAQGAGRAAG